MQTELSRRQALRLGACAGASASLAGCRYLGLGGDDTAPTEPLDEETARELATRFGPTVYFDADERWYPTDPRPYTVERDGETVVDGFAALDGYHRRTGDGDPYPDPTVFYNGRRYVDSPLAVVQFWFYSVFDQFATNFHWHDWEVLHVFVDLDSREPQLLVASAHSRKVPNNEFIDPVDRRPRVLPELGSHSSAMSVNEVADRFLRFPAEGRIADITNRGIGALEALANVPAAYGLPRDENIALPFLVPELDGSPLYEHPDLPNVSRTDLVPEELTVRSLSALASPPKDLPKRSTGTVFAPEGASVDADVDYELVPTGEVESIAGFEGPQLSFEFGVPGFVEDAVAGHITATGVPWDQSRYTQPVADVTDPAHRATLADRYDAVGEGGALSRIVAGLGEVVPDGDAPDGEGVTTGQLGVGGFVLLESDPVAAPTVAGAVVLQDTPTGDHRLTVNVAGTAPYSQQVRVGEGGATPTVTTSEGGSTTLAGADGQVAVVANEDAVKLRVDTEGTDDDVREVAVVDDFGGRLYASGVDGPAAAYVHAEGAYTAEVRDADGVPGAFRVNPDGPGGSVTVEQPDTGKGSLAGFVATLSGETRDRVAGALDVDLGGVLDGGGATSGPVEGLLRALDAAGTAADEAADAAAQGNAERADRRLRAADTALGNVADAMSTVGSRLPDAIAAMIEVRVEIARTRVSQALEVRSL